MIIPIPALVLEELAEAPRRSTVQIQFLITPTDPRLSALLVLSERFYCADPNDPIPDAEIVPLITNQEE